MNVSIPLSIAMAGLDPAAIGLEVASRPNDRGPEVRALLSWVRSLGVPAVQLNAATPGVRPRDLDRSARRDLAATIRREGLTCSGLDLWIPAAHFADPARCERAVEAVVATVELAYDLGLLASGSVVSSSAAAGRRSPVVSIELPADPAPDVLRTIAERAAGRGVRVADHAWPVRETPSGLPAIGIGIDPAAVLRAGADPSGAAAAAGRRLASARLSDLSRSSMGQRLAPGSADGRLDVLGYLAALLAVGYAGPLVVDLRGTVVSADAVRSAVALGRVGSIP